MNSKNDFIKDFIASQQEIFLGAQNWWPKYLFHFTHITNALSILEYGSLLSRNKAKELDLMKNDNANDDVISITSDEYKNYARLYFAPSTPTQYNNEGFKPQNLINDNAHCPIPIMFIFHSDKVFMCDNLKFTDGNLVNHPNIYEDIEDLTKLDFKLIYHRTHFSQEDRNSIVNARHSEILIKDELPIKGNLKLIAVRSEAEKETLLYLMDNKAREFYKDKVYVQPKTGIFINNWLYVREVNIIGNLITILWHGCSNYVKCENNYNIKIILESIQTGDKKGLRKENWYPSSNPMKINIPEDFIDISFHLSIFIDNILAYKRTFPF